MKISKDEFKCADELMDAEDVAIEKQIKGNKSLGNWLMVVFFAAFGIIYLVKMNRGIDTQTLYTVLSSAVILIVITSGLSISVLQYKTIQRIHRLEKKLDKLVK